MAGKNNAIKAVFFSGSGWENHRRSRWQTVDFCIGVAVARPDPEGRPTKDGRYGLKDEPSTPNFAMAEAS